VKIAIVYRSFLGTTKKYATWLHESLDADLFRAGQMSKKKLRDYDLIIICSGTYMGWISLRGYLGKRWEALQDKKVILLVVGLAPEEQVDSVIAYEKIPEHIREHIKYFKVPGTIGSGNVENVKKENLQPVLDYINSLAT